MRYRLLEDDPDLANRMTDSGRVESNSPAAKSSLGGEQLARSHRSGRYLHDLAFGGDESPNRERCYTSRMYPSQPVMGGPSPLSIVSLLRSQEVRLVSDRGFRNDVPRRSHAVWSPVEGRPSPVDVITSQNVDRLGWLVPIRHWRMAESPFTFYRGAAKLMALDLASSPSTGIQAQICGDAHLSNFGFYGSPDRALVFDLNDFDETLPGPWEWDVKRLAASFAIASRNNEFEETDAYELAVSTTSAYRKNMRQLAGMGYLDVWYSRIDDNDILEAFEDDLTKKGRKASEKALRKVRRRDSRHALGKLAEQTEDGYRIISQPPLIIPLRDLRQVAGLQTLESALTAAVADYLESVPDHLGVLLNRFRFVDFAVKVVGVGSVGTRSFIALFVGRDSDDPLFLQIKQATRSVLEDHLPESQYSNSGRRVVEGQRLMQAASDSFLGWIEHQSSGHHYYARQFKDMKGSAEVEDMNVDQLSRYARLCGWTLARAHARSANVRQIADYLGKSDKFEQAIGDFAVHYADQNQADYQEFKSAIDNNEIPAHP